MPAFYGMFIDRAIVMHTVTVSPKFQVVIPRLIREHLKLVPGQKMQVIEYDGRVEFVMDRNISDLRRFVPGINTEFS
jgi:AbrB family looped-hinge helix DNA binding protein